MHAPLLGRLYLDAWLVALVVWIIAALFVKRAERSEPLGSRLIHLGWAAVAAVLLSFRRLPWAPLNVRVIPRSFVLGKASAKMNHVFDIVHRAQTAAVKAARPGLECQAIDAAARKVIADAGYGPAYKFFTHRLGHGIGMNGHEWPYLVQGNTTLMVKNMTFSDEPGIYISGEFGIRLEDDMHITENGAELFTPQSPSLEDPFGAS